MNVRDVRDVDHAIEAVGGLPVVVKVTKGTQGQGVFLRHTAYEAKSLVQGLLHARRDVLIQSTSQKATAVTSESSSGTRWWPPCAGAPVVGNSADFHLNGTVESLDLPDEFLTWPGALPACLA